MKVNWRSIWCDFQRAYDKNACDWPGQKKMIRKIVDSHFKDNDINWKQIWKTFERWTDECPTCHQTCQNGFHTEWAGKDGQEKELERLLKLEVMTNKLFKKKAAA